MQIHPGKPWNLRGAATEKTLVGPTIVANRPGDIRRCFPRLRCVLLAKCTAVIVLMSSFFSGSVELRTGCCATSRCINWDRYYRIAVFFWMTLGMWLLWVASWTDRDVGLQCHGNALFKSFQHEHRKDTSKFSSEYLSSPTMNTNQFIPCHCN